MSEPRQYCVYILASGRNGTLYTGVTGDLVKRAYDHRNNVIPGFTSRYAVHRLVWYEVHREVNAAIRREKCIKKWRRAWKLDLIEALNPYWEDLFDRVPSLPFLSSPPKRHDSGEEGPHSKLRCHSRASGSYRGNLLK